MHACYRYSLSVRERRLNLLQNMHAVASGKRLESEEALQREISVLRILHPTAGADVCSYGRAPQNRSLSSEILASADSIA